MSQKRNDPVQAAYWMFGAVVSFSVMAVAARSLDGALDTFEIMLYRSLLGVFIVTAIAGYRGKLNEIRTARAGLHIGRNASHFIGQNLWFVAVTAIPLSQLFAFEFTTPLWVAAFAPWVLGERWTAFRLVACSTGFLGILLVARPDMSTIEWGTGAAALCAIFFAGATLATKKLTTTDSVTCILFWLVSIQAVFGLICAGYDGDITLLNRQTFPWAMLIGLCGLMAHYCITTALTLAPATVVIPFEFLRLPLLATIGYLLYSEPLQVTVFVGALIILAANIMNVRFEKTGQI